MQKHILIYSHGFGVQKDNRGLFTSIENFIPEAQSVMFDYNEFNENNKTVTIRPFKTQVEMLDQCVQDMRDANQDAVIDIVCHSQGCKVAASAKLITVRKVVLITPPIDTSIERTLERFKNTPGALLDMKGVSRLPRKDGTTTLFPPEYWISKESDTTLINAYNKLANRNEILIIKATEDDVLGDVDLNDLDPKVKLLLLKGDHNFSGNDRVRLLETVRDYLI